MNSTAYATSLPVAARPSSALAAGPRETLRAYLSLTKPRVVSLVLFTALVALVAAADGRPSLGMVSLLLVTGFLSTGGAAALNHYFDRDIDREMARTRRRPLATDRVGRPGLVLLGGSSMVLLGVALAATANLTFAFFQLVGAVVYVVVYTLWLKRRTPLNIVIGGAAGSAAVVGGWALADPSLGIVPWLMAGIVFLWTPAHFWSLALARAGDYRQAGVPMLPVALGARGVARWILLHVVASVGLSAWVGVAGAFGPTYFVSALAGGGVFIAAGLRLLRRPEPASGWQTFKLSGVYLGVIFLGMLVDRLVGVL